MRKIILASGSPRRKELLTMMGLTFEAIASNFDEWLDDTKTPEEMSITLGRGKAREIARQYPDAIVIGSDTIVTVNGKQLGKAVDVTEGREMWRLVTSAPNKITTSAVVICQETAYEFATSDNAFVTFKPYDEAAVEAYLKTDDWHDKAGAWSIQQCRGLMNSVEGDIETIIGLPTRLLVEPLSELGVVATPAGYHL